jgi:DNA modification methylase
MFDAVVTSPCYGNRLADHHNASDPESRRSYTHDLGRDLSAGSSGAMHWGSAYRNFHRAAWAETWRVLRPGGRLVLNIKDHVRKGKRQLVAGWHITHLVSVAGFELLWNHNVETPTLRQGENAAARFAEQVYVLRKPA